MNIHVNIHMNIHVNIDMNIDMNIFMNIHLHVMVAMMWIGPDDDGCGIAFPRAVLRRNTWRRALYNK